jgi:SAM-dependent methyltransferase
MPECIDCGHRELEEIPGFERLPRVTSDSRPWPAGGRLAVCPRCGAVQKPDDAAWREEAARIYADYSPYLPTGGAEQTLCSPDGRQVARTEVVLRNLLDRWEAPARGRMLDVGAGPGAALEAFGRLRDGWRLHALDIDDRHRAVLDRLPGFEALHVGPVDAIAERFHLIAAIHSLEHFFLPGELLVRLRRLLEEGGRLVIQVPFHRSNPLDLVIADHRSHFTPASLRRVLVAGGFRVEMLSTDLLPKELSVIATAGDGSDAVPPPEPVGAARDEARRALVWLETTLRGAGEAAASAGDRPFGILGTAIAAVWLYGVLAERIAFFVDENPALAGTTFMGLPVHAPAQVPAGSLVYLPLAETAARAAAARFAALPFDVAVPGAVA